MRPAALIVTALAGFGLSASASADAVKLKAAGSLKPAMTELVAVFADGENIEVEADYGPSGLLRQRIAGGDPTDVFASANMEHPRALAEKFGGEVVAFAQNKLCALVRPGLEATSETLLDRLLSTDVRVGTSTPKADPSGDYAWELFDKAEAVEPGASEKLKAKALQLTGGPDSAEPPEGKFVYAWVMEERQADIFLTYCTNAVIARRELPELNIVQIPEGLSVGARYGLIVLGDRLEADRLASFVVSPDGQAILASYGFGAPRLGRGRRT